MRASHIIAPVLFLLLPLSCALEEQPSDDDDGGQGGAAAGTQGKAGGGAGGVQAGSAGASSGAGGKGGSGGSVAGANSGGAGTTGGAGTGGAGAAGMAGRGGATGGGGAGGSVGGAGAGGASGGSTGGNPMGGTSGSAGATGGGGTGGAMGSAGGGAGGTGGGGTGNTGFDPCPASEPCKILPLGDSITDGIGFSGGYRVELFSSALADGKSITFVGGSMNGPQTVDGEPFPRAHEGHSGWTVSGIDDIVPDPALGPAPHIILLHIGTNDMYQSPAGADGRLGTLIDQILEELPNSLLVVSNIIPLPSSASAVTTYNNAVPGVVNERKDAGKHILFVDQFEGFPSSELGDGVHPNQAGYARMAAKWYAAISSYLH